MSEDGGRPSGQRSKSMMTAKRDLSRFTYDPWDQVGVRKVSSISTYKQLEALLNGYLNLFTPSARADLPDAVDKALWFISTANIRELKEIFESVEGEKRDDLLRYMQHLWKDYHHLTWNGTVVLRAITHFHNDEIAQRKYLLANVGNLNTDTVDVPLVGWRRITREEFDNGCETREYDSNTALYPQVRDYEKDVNPCAAVHQKRNGVRIRSGAHTEHLWEMDVNRINSKLAIFRKPRTQVPDASNATSTSIQLNDDDDEDNKEKEPIRSTKRRHHTMVAAGDEVELIQANKRARITTETKSKTKHKAKQYLLNEDSDGVGEVNGGELSDRTGDDSDDDSGDTGYSDYERTAPPKEKQGPTTPRLNTRFGNGLSAQKPAPSTPSRDNRSAKGSSAQKPLDVDVDADINDDELQITRERELPPEERWTPIPSRNTNYDPKKREFKWTPSHHPDVDPTRRVPQAPDCKAGITLPSCPSIDKYRTWRNEEIWPQTAQPIEWVRVEGEPDLFRTVVVIGTARVNRLRFVSPVVTATWSKNGNFRLYVNNGRTLSSVDNKPQDKWTTSLDLSKVDLHGPLFSGLDLNEECRTYLRWVTFDLQPQEFQDYLTTQAKERKSESNKR